MSARRRLALATSSVALAVLAGCGGSAGDDSSTDGMTSSFAGTAPAEMVETARSAMKDLRAVHLSGTLSNDGQSADVDLALADDGSCDGTFTIDGGVAEIRAVDGHAWFRPDAEIWATFAGERAEQIIDFVGDRWVVLEDAQFLEMCDFRSIMDSLVASPEAGREYSEGGSEEIDGEDAFRIESSGTGGTSYGYVRADDPHYLVLTERRGGEHPATMTFSDFDVVPEVEVPEEHDIIDLSELAS